MEIAVQQAAARSFLVYPQMFMNDRTRQVMAQPATSTDSLLQDLYVSPIEFDPGRAAAELRARQGRERPAGRPAVRFVGFDLNAEGGTPWRQMAAGGPVTIGTRSR